MTSAGSRGVRVVGSSQGRSHLSRSLRLSASEYNNAGRANAEVMLSGAQGGPGVPRGTGTGAGGFGIGGLDNGYGVTMTGYGP